MPQNTLDLQIFKFSSFLGFTLKLPKLNVPEWETKLSGFFRLIKFSHQYIAESSFGNCLYRHMYKSVFGDAKKVVSCKILSRKALGTPMLSVDRGVD
jgi:hypothetical protein